MIEEVIMLKVGIIGVGTVGTSVANILMDNKSIITARAGIEIVPTIGVVSKLNKKRDINIKLSTNANEVLDDSSIDIVVELMGGVEKPYEIVKKALENGKSVVTANKALLAYHRYELQELAGDTPFEFEAAVAGGIPIITALRDGLSANNIKSIQGILNGTCNFMLTKMANENIEYEEILKEAQKLGYAEADPIFDVGGFDTAHKLLILGSIAYGIDIKPEEILIEGIQNISKIDIEFAKEFKYSIKLLGIAKKIKNEIELRVHPVLIPQKKMISKIDGVMNGISLIGDKVGETMFYGAGAGANATASAVVANIIDIARRGKGSPMLGFEKQVGKKPTLMSKENIKTKYYLRLEVTDKSGTLAKIAMILGNNGISIENMMQRAKENEKANLLLTTHTCIEKDILKAIDSLKHSKVVLTSPVMIRIED